MRLADSTTVPGLNQVRVCVAYTSCGRTGEYDVLSAWDPDLWSLVSQGHHFTQHPGRRWDIKKKETWCISQADLLGATAQASRQSNTPPLCVAKIHLVEDEYKTLFEPAGPFS